MINVIGLKELLKENKLTGKIVAKKTGYNKNTITNWIKSNSDAKLPLDFVLRLLQEFPNIQGMKKHLPTYDEILRLSK